MTHLKAQSRGFSYRWSRSSWGPFRASRVEDGGAKQATRRHTAAGWRPGGAPAPRAHLIGGAGGPGAKAPPPPLHPPRRERAARGALAELCAPGRAGRKSPRGRLASLRSAPRDCAPGDTPSPNLPARPLSAPAGRQPPLFPGVPRTQCLGPRPLPRPGPRAGVPGVALCRSPCATPASPSRPGPGEGRRVEGGCGERPESVVCRARAVDVPFASLGLSSRCPHIRTGVSGPFMLYTVRRTQTAASFHPACPNGYMRAIVRAFFALKLVLPTPGGSQRVRYPERRNPFRGQGDLALNNKIRKWLFPFQYSKNYIAFTDLLLVLPRSPPGIACLGPCFGPSAAAQAATR